MHAVEAVFNAIERHPLISVPAALCHDCADPLLRSKIDLDPFVLLRHGRDPRLSCAKGGIAGCS
jgi:hypothetical protein